MLPGPSSPPTPAPLAPGERMGGYVVERVVARGTQGTLYRAGDPVHGQPRALKVLRIADERRRLRFLREVRAASSLRHPDIVKVEACGEQGAWGWMAMEWLAGQDLGHHVRAPHLLPTTVALSLAARVAEALAAAHRQGVVHRDVKPANLHLDLHTHRITLTDFGSAWAADALVTASGELVGTPLYMAPEQLSGGPLDGRADLYAVGAVLFELLTGQPLFQADTLGELMRQIARQAPPSLSSLRPDLPALLSQVLARVLAKEPSNRQPDGDRLALELRSAAHLLPPPRRF